MITLTAKINLLSGDNNALSIGSNNLSGNNISCEIGDIKGVKRQAKNPFILKSTYDTQFDRPPSELGSGATFSNGVNYFIGNVLSDRDGIFTPYYNFTVNFGGAKVERLTIAFDTANNEHPDDIIVDDGGQEEIFYDDDPVYMVFHPNDPNSMYITIRRWSRENRPLVITGIYVEVSIDIDRRNMIGISRSIFDRSDLKLPSFGIISNTGNIEFNDLDGEIRDYAEQLLLQSGLSCEVRLNNTLIDGASQVIAKMETDQWNYDNDNRVVSVSIKDDLEEWQDINVAPINYDPRVVEHKSFKWLYNHLWGITTKNDNYDMLSFDELDSDTQAVLNNTYTQYPLLESGSLWQQWTKLCQVCQLHIYKNNNGRIVCRYNGGN